jgi:hypothetical protein
MVMNQQVIKNGPHRWKPGESGNRKGRPPGSRQKIAEALLRDIQEVWEACGPDVLLRLANEDPGKLAQIATGLLPREQLSKLEVSQAMPGNLTPDEWATMRGLLDTIERAAPGEERERVFAALDTFLRSELATPIEPPPCPVALPIAECAQRVLVPINDK